MSAIESRGGENVVDRRNGAVPEVGDVLDLAGIAQLVEYELPKLGVAGSNPVARSREW